MSGPTSRSWDRPYVNLRTQFPILGIKSNWETKFFYLFNLDQPNRDMRQRLGYVETSLTLLNILPEVFTDSELQLSIVPGGKFDFDDFQGSRALSFRFRLWMKRFDPFIYMQIYNGFNESLLFYKSNRTSYRIGIAL